MTRTPVFPSRRRGTVAGESTSVGILGDWRQLPNAIDADTGGSAGGGSGGTDGDTTSGSSSGTLRAFLSTMEAAVVVSDMAVVPFTQPVIVSASGGSGEYTYHWEGSQENILIETVNGAVTRFSPTSNTWFTQGDVTADFCCMVSDSTGAMVNSGSVTVTFSYRPAIAMPQYVIDADIFVVEGHTTVATAEVLNLPTGASISHALSGTDDETLHIDSATGNIVFNPAPVFASPADDNTDNVYEVDITGTLDNGQGGTITAAIRVHVMEAPPVTSSLGVSFAPTSLSATVAHDALNFQTTPLSVNVTGGRSPYQHTWRRRSGTNNISTVEAVNGDPSSVYFIISNVTTSGIYEMQLTVTDADGSTFTVHYAISLTKESPPVSPPAGPPPPPPVPLAMTVSASSVTIATTDNTNESYSGAISAAWSGGIAPYIFQWRSGGSGFEVTAVNRSYSGSGLSHNTTFEAAPFGADFDHIMTAHVRDSSSPSQEINIPVIVAVRNVGGS